MTDVTAERAEAALAEKLCDAHPDDMASLPVIKLSRLTPLTDGPLTDGPLTDVPPTDGPPANGQRVHGLLTRLRAVGDALSLTYTAAFVDEWSPRRGLRARIAGLVFLVFLVWPIKAAVHGDHSVAVLALIFSGLAAFAVCFVVVIWRNTPVLHGNQAPRMLGATIVVGVLLLVPIGTAWLTPLSYYVISMLLFNCPISRWPVIVLSVPFADVVIDRFLLGVTTGAPFMVAVEVLLVGAIQAAFYQQISAKLQLRQARAHLARLAVIEERLRIARDLHDILGQRLSALSLKAELAARLAGRDAERAAAEMVEVAAVARAALADVRLTVSGYRQTSLAAEIETARALLTAAGVVLDATSVELPGLLDECTGWLVREAVTNVVRHSSASLCEIRVSWAAGSVVAEVRDNGRGDNASHTYGNGLTGLAERVECVRGELWTGRDRGWFIVRASFNETAVRTAAARTAVVRRQGLDSGYAVAPGRLA